MKIALIDLKEGPKGCNNKDKAGTFGNAMRGEGFISSIYGTLKGMNVHTPVMHFGYLAAIFRQSGHTVHYYESFPQDEDMVILASSIVGYDEELAFSREVRKRNPRVKIGFIGAFATVRPEIFLDGGGDFVMPGEPEWAAKEMAENRLEPKGILPKKLLEGLDQLPFPDWNVFPVKSYSYWPGLKKRPLLPMLSSRGCSFDCSYCPYMVTQTEKFRIAPAHYVVNEIQHLQRWYGVRSVVFRDIIFTINKKKTAELCEEILQRNIRVDFSCETRTDCLNEELLKLMARSGLRAVHLGLESPADDIVLQNGRKPIAELHQEEIIRICERLGIKVFGFYILGFLQDTPKTMQSTIDYAKRLNTYMAQFDVMTPYPGTKYYDTVQDRLVTQDWKQYTTYRPVLRLDHSSSEEVLYFKRKAYREYYCRWSWLLKNGFKIVVG
jgi:anaerobic magnesium-protoporphyrin IX monomethyl ester cyclase